MGLTGALMRAYDDPTDPPSGVPGALLKQVPCCRTHKSAQRKCEGLAQLWRENSVHAIARLGVPGALLQQVPCRKPTSTQ